jgi:hypothetical protein
MASSERADTASAHAATTPAVPIAAAPGADAFASDALSGQGRGEEGLDHSSGAASAEGSALVDGLKCDLLMNARYHASREAFLDSIHRALMFLIIVLGAAAITDLFNWPWVKGVFAACAVLFAALDLTADLSNRARCHALMKRRYFELLADLTGHHRKPIQILEHMHRFSADEEPAFHALLAVSWNAAQEMVYGDYADKYVIPRWHRLLKNIRRYAEVTYPTTKGPRPATA